MNVLKKSLLATVMAMGLGMAGSAHAVLVDLFDDPLANGVQTVTSTSVGTTVAQEYPGIAASPSTSILGGYRDLITTVVASNGFGTPSSTLEVGGGGLSFSTSSGDRGVGIIQWDGKDGDLNNGAGLNYTGLGGEDLINQLGCPALGCDRFVATVIVADLGFEYSIGVYTDADNYSILRAFTQEAIGDDEVSETADYLFAWFLLAENNLADPTDFYFLDGLAFTIEREGTVDFTNIGALEFTINSNGATVAVDLALDSVMKRGVPEPGALALAGIALLGVVAAGRRRKAVTKS